MTVVINSDVEGKAQDEDFKKYKLSLARIKKKILQVATKNYDPLFRILIPTKTVSAVGIFI